MIPTRLGELDKMILRTINRLEEKVEELEEKMAGLEDKLNMLKASVEAAFQRGASDLEALKAQIAAAGQMSPEVEALIDGMIQRAEAFDVANPPTPEAIRAAP